MVKTPSQGQSDKELQNQVLPSAMQEFPGQELPTQLFT